MRSWGRGPVESSERCFAPLQWTGSGSPARAFVWVSFCLFFLHRGAFLLQLAVLARADAVHSAPRIFNAHPEAGHCDSMRKLACQPSFGCRRVRPPAALLPNRPALAQRKWYKQHHPRAWATSIVLTDTVAVLSRSAAVGRSARSPPLHPLRRGFSESASHTGLHASQRFGAYVP